MATGDSLGEEGLLEKKPQAEGIFVKREEMATAEEESYVLEIS